MSRLIGSAPPDRRPPTTTTESPLDEVGPARAADLSALPIAGLTRRRMAIVASAMLAAWIVIAFGRQVSDASAAATRAQDNASGNIGRRLQVAAMERELDAIARQRFIDQQARAYGLGGRHETAFALEPGAPALAADAPGSAAVRLGAEVDDVTPLERWLTVLFGPSV